MSPKRKSWKSRLTSRQVRHLRQMAGVSTLTGLKRTLAAQEAMQRRTGYEACPDCRGIGAKLGLDG